MLSLRFSFLPCSGGEVVERLKKEAIYLPTPEQSEKEPLLGLYELAGVTENLHTYSMRTIFFFSVAVTLAERESNLPSHTVHTTAMHKYTHTQVHMPRVCMYDEAECMPLKHSHKMLAV